MNPAEGAAGEGTVRFHLRDPDPVELTQAEVGCAVSFETSDQRAAGRRPIDDWNRTR